MEPAEDVFDVPGSGKCSLNMRVHQVQVNFRDRAPRLGHSSVGSQPRVSEWPRHGPNFPSTPTGYGYEEQR
jgi:hypothetical protein